MLINYTMCSVQIINRLLCTSTDYRYGEHRDKLSGISEAARVIEDLKWSEAPNISPRYEAHLNRRQIRLTCVQRVVWVGRVA